MRLAYVYVCSVCATLFVGQDNGGAGPLVAAQLRRAVCAAWSDATVHSSCLQSTVGLALIALALLLIYVGMCYWKGRDAVTTHPEHGFAL